MKKKLVIVLFIVIAIWGFFQYRTINIFDEIYMTGKKLVIFPYTDTEYPYDHARTLIYDEIRDSTTVIGGFIYNEDSERYIEVLFSKNKMKLYCARFAYGYYRVRFWYEYDIWTKRLSSHILVYDTQTEEWNRITEIDEAEQILRENGTSLDEIRSFCEGEINAMLIDWVTSNGEKTDYSREYYGVYIEDGWILEK